jgi:LAO/AO transport system kinase
MRLGISGVPGVGKSTFIEALGLFLIGRGPSRGGAGGRPVVQRLRRLHPRRQDAHGAALGAPAGLHPPQPGSGTLGGVAEKTREAMLVCEAAGYDVVIVETVGVGQSETAVAGMTDMFVLLQLPNAGDDLQAIKKGVMELADLVVINKADLDEARPRARRAQITSLRCWPCTATPTPHMRESIAGTRRCCRSAR